MCWKNVDLDRRWWTVPASDAKNGLPHRVPLSDLAIIGVPVVDGGYAVLDMVEHLANHQAGRCRHAVDWGAPSIVDIAGDSAT